MVALVYYGGLNTSMCSFSLLCTMYDEKLWDASKNMYGIIFIFVYAGDEPEAA